MIPRSVLLFTTCLILTIVSVCAAPVITDWNNSISTDLYPVVPYDTSVTFNITANESLVTTYWYVDDTLTTHSPGSIHDTFSTSWTAAGTHNVSVYGNNTNGDTQLLSWYPHVQRQIAATTPTQVSVVYYDNLTSMFAGETDPWDLFFVSTTVYTNVIGGLFFAFMFGSMYYTLWTRTKSMIIPTVLAFIMGTFMFGLMPEDYKMYGILFLSIGVVSVLYKIFAKNRG